MESEMRTYHELFTEEYFATAESTRTNCMKELPSLHALFRTLLVLPIFITSTGDINLHPGPIQYPCSVCTRAVRKRVISSDNCSLWVHKKCYTPSRNASSDSSYIYRPCKDSKNDPSDNIWSQFPFLDDYFAGDKTVPSETQSNFDLETSSSTDSRKVFSKRGLHLIHLNTNSIQN